MPFPEQDAFLTGVPLGSTAGPSKSQKSAKAVPGTPGAPKRASAIHVVMLVLVPWSIFTVISCLFAFVFHFHMFVVWIFVTVCAIIGKLFLALHPARNEAKGPAYLYMGLLILFATFMATLLGGYNYYEYMNFYYGYSDLRVYTNVLPTELASAHLDAATMVFTEDSRVDSTKALGYKADQVYCVAPIMDDTQAARVEYWAAGVNCCSQRGDFNCDDAFDPDAKSGVVVLSPSSWFPTDHSMYMKAVKQAEAAYGLVSSPTPLFVRWATDPLSMENEFWEGGMSFLIITVAVYFGVSIILGGMMYMAR